MNDYAIAKDILEINGKIDNLTNLLNTLIKQYDLVKREAPTNAPARS